jgi:SAM-dependent methyltransferase
MSSHKCRLCQGGLFPEPIIRLEGMPKAAQHFPLEDEFAFDLGIVLDVFQCAACGLVQLACPPVDYYKEVITATRFSPETRDFRLDHMKGIVARFGLKDKKALEIGCGEGGMLDVLAEAGLAAVGMEASERSVAAGRAAGRTVLNAFIDDVEKINGGPFDLFISYNFLEHLPNPDGALKTVYSNTSLDAVGYVTVPNLDYLVETRCFYEFVADHLSYFTKSTLSFALERNGFEVLKCEEINNRNDVAVLVKKRQAISLQDDYRNVQRLIQDLQRIVGDYVRRSQKVAIWGAGHRTLALMALGQLAGVEYVVDSAKFKQGRFTPVLHRPVVSPEHLRSHPVDCLLIMVPGRYPEEVLKSVRAMGLPMEVAMLRENRIEFVEERQRT